MACKLISSVLFSTLLVTSALAQPRELSRIFSMWSTVNSVEIRADQLRIFTANNGILIYDISDPEIPELISTLEQYNLVGNGPVRGDLYFTEQRARITLLDLSNLQAPSVVSQINHNGEQFICANASDDFLFVVRGDFIYQPGWPWSDWRWYEALYSIENPQEPQRFYARTYEGYHPPDVVSTSIFDHHLYLQGPESIRATDISNPNELREIAFRNNVYSSALNQTGDLLAVNRSANGYEISILTALPSDTLDPLSIVSSIQQVTEHNKFGWIDDQLFVADNDTLSLWSLDNPTEPLNTVKIRFAGVSDCALFEDKLAVTNGKSVTLFDIENPEAPSHLTTFENAGRISHLSKDNNRLYVAAGTAGVRIVDVADPSSPTEIDHWRGDWPITLIDVDSNLAVVSSSDSGLFAMLDLNNFNILGIQRLAGIVNIALRDGFVFLKTRSSYIYDCRNPQRIALAQDLGRVAFHIQDNHLYTWADDQIQVYDITNPANRQLLRTMPIAAGMDISISGNLLHTIWVGLNPYAPPNWYDLFYRVYDISDPAEPSLVEECYLDNYENEGNVIRLQSANQGKGIIYDRHRNCIRVIEIIGGGDPHFTATIDLDQQFYSLEMDDDIGYIAVGSSARIFDFSGFLKAPTTTDDYFQPTTFSLSAFPNPFNSSVTISFSSSLSSSSLRIYDISGRLVTDLTTADPPRSAGMHKVTWDASAVGAGVYLLSLRAGDNFIHQKVVLIR